MSTPTPAPLVLTPLEEALKESLMPPDFRDVHLYAFSRRIILPNGSSKIDHPLPIVAVGSILKKVEYFSDLLSSGFAESGGAPPALRQSALGHEYDYESDSDLDEFESRDEVLPLQASGSGSSSALESPSSQGKGKGKSMESGSDTLVDSVAAESEEPMSKPGYHAKHREILLPNIAYRTLRSCVFYLYTGKVNFLPLTSASVSDRQLAMYTAAVPPCSPKSMYRLAEVYGLTALQNLAYDAIVSRLTPANIVEEAFSTFYWRYDPLREHAVSFLSRNFSDSRVQASLPDVIDQVVSGQLPHTGALLRSLLGLRIAMRVTRARPEPPPPLRTPQPRSFGFAPFGQPPPNVQPPTASFFSFMNPPNLTNTPSASLNASEVVYCISSEVS
ncbi:hypothetical protein BD413DRAFT_462698 [Trametes elegans]|nr:hypothetical protein BD413DRAFT_462698 [Trametes elegans]